jgi:hypothetical protein
LLEFYTQEISHLVEHVYARDFAVLDYCRGWHCILGGDLG